ncbi:Protein CBG27271 [Caenorhabditis briggsae]|uniref:Protein CBG27271 n=1 Tax=Caenorhabditis briggsae TaxID=6238 RepID=B6IKE8_CAEBR|nr:Protein CBG27271 [Caenorhabditis briggsae]CAS00378.1 Protein CBG27271 [Caenorhabditis briggsae]
MCREKHGRKMVADSDLPSILETRIISRDFSHLSFAVSNWHEFETIQDEMNGGKIGFQNVFQMTCTVNNDIDLSWKMVHKQFPATQNLKTSDQSALLRNFMLKLWQIEPILDNIFNDEKYMNMNDEGFENLIVSFYERAFLEGQEMSREETLRIFQPYWSFYYLKMVMPIVVLDLERAELMSIIWLLFFDNGYTNISPECQEMCRNIKKVILRELKNYQEFR